MSIKFIFPLLLSVLFLSNCSQSETPSTQNKETSTVANTTNNTAPTPKTETTENSSNAPTKEKNLLSIGAGAFIIKAPSEYNRGWWAYGLIDENLERGWSGSKNNVTNQTIVFQLPSRTTFKTIGFDTGKVDTDNTAAKDVLVEVSDTSADAGFQPILSTTLKDKTDAQDFSVEKEIGGRFIKVTAKNNFGSDEFLEIMEIRGYGTQEAQKPFEKSVSGTYNTKEWGDFHIKQEGTSIVGCYEYQGGLLEGGLDGRIMTLSWKEDGDTDKDRGPAVFLFDDNAKKFVGIWGYSDENFYSGEWDGEKTSDQVGNCEHFKNLSNENAAGSKIKEELEKDGRAAVYGINFDFNSDKIKDESKPTLDQIVKILKENSAWKMTVEGHTDNIGGDAFNQTLSEKRANAVKKYLIEAGVEEARLTAKGIGLSSPVAPNDTEASRARNRRVELVKQ